MPSIPKGSSLPEMGPAQPCGFSECGCEMGTAVLTQWLFRGTACFPCCRRDVPNCPKGRCPRTEATCQGPWAGRSHSASTLGARKLQQT